MHFSTEQSTRRKLTSGLASVWGGEPECVFEGIMDALLYIDILRQTLLPFLAGLYPDGHRFMADNDPKHSSRAAHVFLHKNGVTWWQTPAESPDLNPIENLRHELKEYNWRVVKPKTKQELIDGIQPFWETVDIAKCRKYILHSKSYIECNWTSTDY